MEQYELRERIYKILDELLKKTGKRINGGAIPESLYAGPQGYQAGAIPESLYAGPQGYQAGAVPESLYAGPQGYQAGTFPVGGFPIGGFPIAGECAGNFYDSGYYKDKKKTLKMYRARKKRERRYLDRKSASGYYKMAKNNPWINFFKEWQLMHPNITGKNAMKLASKEYKKFKSRKR